MSRSVGNVIKVVLNDIIGEAFEEMDFTDNYETVFNGFLSDLSGRLSRGGDRLVHSTVADRINALSKSYRPEEE